MIEDANGTLNTINLGGLVQVNETQKSTQNGQRVIVLEDGRILFSFNNGGLVWQSGVNARAASVTDDGSLVFDQEFRVSEPADFAPHNPEILELPDGRLLYSYGSVSEVYAWAADCCGEAGPRRCPPDHADEMEPSQIAVQVLRGDAAIAAQETLQLAVAAIDRLNVEGIPDPLSGRKVQGFVTNAHGRSAGRIAAMTVRNQNDVGIQNRFEHRLQGLGVDRRKNLADGCAAAIGGDQDRHLFIRQAALAGLAATLARLAIQSARSLVALKHVSLVNFDNALEFRPILACGLQETVPPAEGRIDAKSASTGRFPYRLALGQRHAE